MLLVSGLALGLAACTHPPFQEGVPLERYGANEDSGFNANKLAELTTYLEENTPKGVAMMALQDGKVFFEYGDIQEVSYLASARKSILSMLYGAPISDGRVDLNATLGDLGIDDREGLLDIEKTATVDHILTARSGVFHPPANGGYDEDNVLPRGSVTPGSYWLYNNWDFNVAGHIFEQATGKSIYEELERQLAIPLGFQDWNIRNQKKTENRSRSCYPAYHMYISTRDMAKIGQLMLNMGAWNGQQLIDRDWLEKSIQVVTPLETVIERYGDVGDKGVNHAYSYYWWNIASFFGDTETYQNAYTASGWGGQYITVFPDQNLVIAFKTKLSTTTLWGLTHEKVADPQYWGIVKQLLEARD